VAIAVNVALGVVMSVAMYALLARATSRRRALVGGLLVAAHPALVPYVVALMTEGATVALLALALALGVAAASPRGPLGRRALAAPAYVLAGIVLGVAVLVRPQCLVLAPVCGGLFVGRRARLPRRLGSVITLTAIVLATVAPWTLRNCARMKSCALVSVNGGWNLLIGEQTRSGAWEAVKVPEPCRTVWDEAKKDNCFGDVARANIAREPASWLARAPKKLEVTFDYFGGAPWYLHQSSPERFPYDAKVALGTVETVVSRLALVGALVALARLRGPRRRARGIVAVVAVVFALSRHAWPAYLALVVAGLLLGPRALARGPAIVPASLAVVASTALLHAVFFGAGRYGLVAAPFVCALAVLPRRVSTR
jgi:4-amino-4-deoxy-L-arabinose transferase-like glycosyltransferase